MKIQNVFDCFVTRSFPALFSTISVYSIFVTLKHDFSRAVRHNAIFLTILKKYKLTIAYSTTLKAIDPI
jgi:hypothetical protein